MKLEQAQALRVVPLGDTGYVVAGATLVLQRSPDGTIIVGIAIAGGRGSNLMPMTLRQVVPVQLGAIKEADIIALFRMQEKAEEDAVDQPPAPPRLAG